MRTTHPVTTNLGRYILLAKLIALLNFAGILLYFNCFVKVKHTIGRNYMVGPIDMRQKGNTLVRHWVNYVTLTTDLTFDLDLEFFKVEFEIAVSHKLFFWLMWNKIKANQLDMRCWPWPWIFSHKKGRANWCLMKGMWIHHSWPWVCPLGNHDRVGGYKG